MLEEQSAQVQVYEERLAGMQEQLAAAHDAMLQAGGRLFLVLTRPILCILRA